MIIYLDESGDLGFDFSYHNTSRYFVISGLICEGRQAKETVHRAIKRTLKNKLPANIAEIKGTNTTLTTKKYFFEQLEENKEWQLISITIDKFTWLRGNNNKTKNKHTFYDETVKLLLSEIKFPTETYNIEIIIDKSKKPSALQNFNSRISATLRQIMPNKTLLILNHRSSHLEAGLQAVDLFCWGIYRKHQNLDDTWYNIFKHRMTLELEFTSKKRKTAPIM